MVQFQRIAALVAVVVAVSIGSCYLAGMLFGRSSHHHPHHHDAHLWIHEQLAISQEQDQALSDTERRYAQRRDRLTEVIRQANGELADAIINDQHYSPRVIAAVETIHQAQGDLQKVTLEHVFEMKETLTPQQYEKLLSLTAAALRGQSSPKSVGHGP